MASPTHSRTHAHSFTYSLTHSHHYIQSIHSPKPTAGGDGPGAGRHGRQREQQHPERQQRVRVYVDKIPACVRSFIQHPSPPLPLTHAFPKPTPHTPHTHQKHSYTIPPASAGHGCYANTGITPTATTTQHTPMGVGGMGMGSGADQFLRDRLARHRSCNAGEVCGYRCWRGGGWFWWRGRCPLFFLFCTHAHKHHLMMCTHTYIAGHERGEQSGPVPAHQGAAAPHHGPAPGACVSALGWMAHGLRWRNGRLAPPLTPHTTTRHTTHPHITTQPSHHNPPINPPPKKHTTRRAAWRRWT